MEKRVFCLAEGDKQPSQSKGREKRRRSLDNAELSELSFKREEGGKWAFPEAEGKKLTFTDLGKRGRRFRPQATEKKQRNL